MLSSLVPVSAEVAGTEFDQIMAEADILRKIDDNVCIKVPLTPDGLRACSTFVAMEPLST